MNCQSRVNPDPGLCRALFQATHGKLSIFAVRFSGQCTAHVPSLTCAFPGNARHTFCLCREPMQSTHGKATLPDPPPCPFAVCIVQSTHGKLTIWSSPGRQVHDMCALCRVPAHGIGLCRVVIHSIVTIWPLFSVFFLIPHTNIVDR